MDKITKKSGIYLLTNKINNKIYVGKAKNIQYRILKHKNSNKPYYKSNYPIARAIIKYGWNNFEVKILEIFDFIDDKKLLEKEHEWIIKLDSINQEIGYNIVEYGTDFTGRHHSEESKRKISETRKKTNKLYNRIQNTENIKRKVKQIDLKTGEIIKVWDSIKDASLFLTGKNKANPSICRVCRKYITKDGWNSKSALGYYWEYVESKEKDFLNLRVIDKKPHIRPKASEETRKKMSESRKRRVKQIDINTGEIIKIWKSSIEASIGLTGSIKSVQSIRRCCRKKSINHNTKNVISNYKWEYINKK